jgi:ABC-2 type transport system permease protein
MTGDRTNAVPTNTRRGPAVPSALRLGSARTGIELRMFFRERDTVVFTFAFPVIMLFIFGSVFSTEIRPGVSFKQYFAAGMLASGIVLSSFQSLAISIAMEREDGTLKRLRGTPVRLDLRARDGGRHGARNRLLLGAEVGQVRRGGGQPGGDRAPVHLRGVLRLQRYPGLDAEPRRAVPAEVVGPGHALGVPAGAFEAAEVGGSWQLPQTAMVLGAWAVVGLLVCLWTFRWSRRDAG